MSYNDEIIRVVDISKRYEIYSNPLDRLRQFILPKLYRLFQKRERIYFKEFWPLRNITFSVKRGQSIGIIGRNGSGKSTLLQVISGTLNPTMGQVEYIGKIAALLELGSGFNPEFTGRENIYLNASILGLSKKEIDRKYDSIVSFADIGEFIEQPVKTYSSGMYVRLAFAVIAHVDADILIVDEALAVGDAIFTQKCMQFIRDFKNRGSLLFVSHDIMAVQNLCDICVWLKDGKIEQIGKAKDVCESYLQYTFQEQYGANTTLQSLDKDPDGLNEDPETSGEENIDRPEFNYESNVSIVNNLDNAKGWQTGRAFIEKIEFKNLDNKNTDLLKGGEWVRVFIQAKALDRLDKPIIGFLVKDRLGQDLFGENTLPVTEGLDCSVGKGQTVSAHFEFRMPMLPNGNYALMASIADGTLESNVQHHWMHDALILNVQSSKIRWGLVGVEFRNITIETSNAA